MSMSTSNLPTTFRQLLSLTSDQVERPKALAEGHYIGIIKNHEFGVSSKKKTPFVKFVLQPLEETQDVDEGANEGIVLEKKELSATFYLTAASIYRLTDALDAILGAQPGVPTDQRIPDTRNTRVMFKVTQRPNEDGTEFYNEVGAIVAAED